MIVDGVAFCDECKQSITRGTGRKVDNHLLCPECYAATVRALGDSPIPRPRNRIAEFIEKMIGSRRHQVLFLLAILMGTGSTLWWAHEQKKALNAAVPAPIRVTEVARKPDIPDPYYQGKPLSQWALLLADRDESVGEAAEQAFVAAGIEAFAMTRQLIRSSDLVVAMRSLEIFSRLTAQKPSDERSPLASELLALARDKTRHIGVRLQAYRYAAKWSKSLRPIVAKELVDRLPDLNTPAAKDALATLACCSAQGAAQLPRIKPFMDAADKGVADLASTAYGALSMKEDSSDFLFDTLVP